MKIYKSLLAVLLTFVFVCAQNNTAKIRFMIGSAERLPANETSWEKTSLNDKVFEGDRIKTALNSRVELEMPDQSVIRIDQNSIFDVKDIKTEEESGEDNFSFTLWAGNVWAKFTKVLSGRKSRTIESPSAVVAVRGTTFEVNVDQDLTTRVAVEEGEVLVTSKDTQGEVTVRPNQQTIVRKGKSPTDPETGEESDESQSDSRFPFQVNRPPLQITDPAVLSRGVELSGRTLPGSFVEANGQPFNVGPNGEFRGQVRINEGFNSITINASNGEFKHTERIRLFVNTKAPQVRLSTPLVSGFLNKRDYSLSGAIFDQTPLDKIKVTINGEEIIEVRQRGSFNRTIILKEGRNDINIVATDLSNNQIQKVERIFLDTVKPIITVTEPAQPNFVRFEPPPNPDRFDRADKERFRQVIRGVIIDPQPSSGLKRIVINGQEIRPNTDGSFETEIILQRGDNRLTFYAEDLAGNIARDNTRRIFIR